MQENKGYVFWTHIREVKGHGQADDSTPLWPSNRLQLEFDLKDWRGSASQARALYLWA